MCVCNKSYAKSDYYAQIKVISTVVSLLTCPELNFLWAIHQIHHSAEDYNFTTAIRNHTLQRVNHIGFYQPLALLGFPMPAIIVHTALNFLFQFWLHTELIGGLGPLGWVLNTPSFHRVHHGTLLRYLEIPWYVIALSWNQ